MDSKFHLALPCMDIQETKAFYLDCIGASLGRETEKWIDINLFGHQITFTNAGDFKFDFKEYRLGKHILPSFHFGVIVDNDEWGILYKKMFQDKELDITMEVSFMESRIGEHLSFFVKDPNGFTIEFKSFKNDEEIFLSNGKE